MAKFMFVFRGGAFVHPELSAADVGAHLAKWHKWVGDLVKAGRTEPGGGPLHMEGKTLRGAQKTMTDGPFAEAKDVVTGNLIVLAASLDEAAELARGCPVFELDGSVEVRPIRSMEA